MVIITKAITRLLITPGQIEVSASCNGDNGYEIAGLVSEWIDWLKSECADQILHWSEITQMNFGQPPNALILQILKR